MFRSRNKIIFCIILTVLAGISTVAIPKARAAAEEYQIKAVFLYNFISFVTWPEDAQQLWQAHFPICVLGEDPFGLTLDLTLAKQKRRGVPIVPERISYAGQAAGACGIIFISRSEQDRLVNILNQLRGAPSLIVSDIEGSAQAGVHIELKKVDDRIRLVINLDSVNDAGLKIKANLLRLATILRGNHNGSK